jgi:hypothetical protein
MVSAFTAQNAGRLEHRGSMEPSGQRGPDIQARGPTGEVGENGLGNLLRKHALAGPSQGDGKNEPKVPFLER